MRFIFLCFLALIMASPLLGQEYKGAVVSKIEITGTHKIDEDFVHSRIQTRIKNNVTWEQLIEDQTRLNRLAGVQYTAIEVDTLADESIVVRYEIFGQRTIQPQLGFGFIDDSYWFQVGAAEYNLDRRNQTLIGYFLYQDGRPNAKLYFESPFFKGKQWGFWVDAFRTATIEPLFFSSGRVDYNYNLSGIGIGGIHHFGLLDKLTYSLTYFNEQYTKINAPSEFTDGPEFLSQNKFLFSATYLHDKLKFKYFYRTGYQHMLQIQNVQTINDDLSFWSVAYEGRHFIRPWPKTNIAGQLRLAVGSNNDTPFAPFVLDSNFNLRGVGNRVDRATAQLILNLEVRQTVYTHKFFAIQMVGFSDTGSWRPPGSELTSVFEQGNFRSFLGGGARLILTQVFDAVIRLDYGVDVLNPSQQGFVLGFGQFF